MTADIICELCCLRAESINSRFGPSFGLEASSECCGCWCSRVGLFELVCGVGLVVVDGRLPTIVFVVYVTVVGVRGVGN